MKNRPGLRILILITVLVSSCSLYLAILTPDRFGFYHDDGIYVVTAKALATGQGYRIISLPYEPAQTKYPPFYPFLLSLIWRIHPQFPQNLLPMMFLSVLVTVAFLALSWCYLTREKYASEWLALLAVALAAINWRTVLLATSIYSETVYAALSVAGLWLAESYEKEGRRWPTGVSLGVVLSLAFLTRTSGITLLIAVVLYYSFRKQFAKASLVLAIGGVFVFAWIAWCYTNRTTVENVTAAYYTSYVLDFKENVPDFQTLLGTTAKNVFLLVFTYIPLVSLGLVHVEASTSLPGSLIIISVTFLFILVGFFRHISAGFRLLHLYVIFYLIFHLPWPYTSYDRFLMPILPFLLLFLITEIEVLITSVRNSLTAAGQLFQKLAATFLSLTMLGVLGFGVYKYTTRIYWSWTSLKKTYASRALEDALAIRWINEYTDLSDVLVCYRDPTYYLYTGRKAIRSFLWKEKVSTEGEAAMYERAKIVFRIINESKGRYLILTSSEFELEYGTELLQKSFKVLLEQYPEAFIPVFQSGDGSTAIYRIDVRPLV